MNFSAIMGIPIPKLIYIPSFSSSAARRTILSLARAAGESDCVVDSPSGALVVRL